MEGERGHNGPIFGQKGHISRRFKLVILFSGHFNVSYKCGGGPLQQNRHLHLLWRGHSKTPLLVDQSILHAQEEGFLKYRMLSVLTETGFCYICHAFIREYTTQITEKIISCYLFSLLIFEWPHYHYISKSFTRNSLWMIIPFKLGKTFTWYSLWMIPDFQQNGSHSENNNITSFLSIPMSS